ncbi:MAG: hypothetical protein ACPG31_10430 [Planctomycetota bacterium]
MLLRLNLELPGFQDALADLLPKGITVDACELDENSLRLACRAPLVGKVVLTAKVRVQPGKMQLSSFALEGAGIAKSMILGKLRDKLSELDVRRDPLRLWGDSDGSVAYLSWPS